MNENCPICLGDLNENNSTKTTSCFHSFHEQCLTRWLVTANTCPMCRTQLCSDEDLLMKRTLENVNNIVSFFEQFVTRYNENFDRLAAEDILASNNDNLVS